MKRRLVYLHQALRDLANIADWSAENGATLAKAEAYVGKLRARCRKLAANPATLGRVRDDLGLELRSVAHQSYVIFFRYVEDRFEILRVVRGARDFDAMFENEEM